MQDLQIANHTTYASPCSELIRELRVHSNQGAAFLAKDNAQLVLLQVDLPKQSHDQFVVDATCIDFGWSTRRMRLLWYYPVTQAVDVNNSSLLTF